MADRGFLTFGGIEVRNPGLGGVQSRVLPTRFTNRFMSNLNPSDAVGFAPGADRSAAPVNGGGTVEEQENPGGSALIVWIGLALLLVALHFVRQNSGDLQQNLLGINLFNLFVVTITAIVGITLFKVAFTKIPIPGVTQVVQAV